MELQNSTQSLIDYYDKWWENPNDPRSGVFAKLNRFVFDRIPPGNGKRALDVGSGCGTIVDMLLKRGYQVDAVEVSPEAVAKMRARFPQANIIQADLKEWEPTEQYDLITMIEIAANFGEADLCTLLAKMRAAGKKVLINNSSYDSLHGRWNTFRGFSAPFVHLYRVKEFERFLRQSDFEITYRAGVGFLVPITLFTGFRGLLIPKSVARVVNSIADPLFPRWCSLYYLEVE